MIGVLGWPGGIRGAGEWPGGDQGRPGAAQWDGGDSCADWL